MPSYASGGVKWGVVYVQNCGVSAVRSRVPQRRCAGSLWATAIAGRNGEDLAPARTGARAKTAPAHAGLPHPASRAWDWNPCPPIIFPVGRPETHSGLQRGTYRLEV